jgi:hypothetical protein
LQKGQAMSAPDLFSWPELVRARADVDAAHEALAEAERAYRFARDGQKLTRLKALRKANQQALKAELALHDLTAGDAA